MAKSLVVMLFVALALPAQASDQAVRLWWAQTTSTLNVRQGDNVVGQLAEGQYVYVLGPDAENGWVEIEYDLNPDTRHRVSTAYIMPVKMPQRVKPQIGERSFRMIWGGKEVTVDGHTYPELTAFDYLEEGDGIYRLIGFDGTPLSVTAEELPDSLWITRKWDWANNIPTTLEAPIGSRYYHGFTRLLSHRWFYWTLFLGLFVYVGLFAVGIGQPQVALVGFLLLIPLWIGSCQGDGYNALQHRAEIAGGLLEGARTVDGHLKPIPSSWISHNKGGWLKFGDWLWVPIFGFAHAILVVIFPWVFRGAHFLLVPHPAEKHLASVFTTGQLDTAAVAASVGHGDMDNPPPAWVSQNQKRRLDALRERFRAETGLLNSIIDFKRNKARLEDP